MILEFFKYQGTGNDFILIDNRSDSFPKADYALVEKLCNRHMGIGADGLILLEKDVDTDFKMVYFNSDGKEGSMCGNGGRCIVAFAKFLGVIESETTFNAVDGKHLAQIENGVVSLKMQDVEQIFAKPNYFFLDTGSPHHVQLVSDLETLDVTKEGAKIRYGLYGKAGSNINYVEQKGRDQFFVRTYERGVEDETLSCGTGVTAVALSMYSSGKAKENSIQILTKGGNLRVAFDHKEGRYTNIWLIGPATSVFKGSVEV